MDEQYYIPIETFLVVAKYWEMLRTVDSTFNFTHAPFLVDLMIMEPTSSTLS